LWTNVDQLKTQTDALCPFLPEPNVLFELGIKVSYLFRSVAYPGPFQVLWNSVPSEPRETKTPKLDLPWRTIEEAGKLPCDS
jgi:hypothetical protein